MTVDEAKTKWCPMARVDSYNQYTPSVQRVCANREIEAANPEWSRCIASQCMMWREIMTGSGECGLTIPGILNVETRNG